MYRPPQAVCCICATLRKLTKGKIALSVICIPFFLSLCFARVLFSISPYSYHHLLSTSIVCEVSMKVWWEVTRILLSTNTAKGRHVIAKRDLGTGEVVLTSEPYSLVAAEEYLDCVCHNCFNVSRKHKPYPERCEECGYVRISSIFKYKWVFIFQYKREIIFKNWSIWVIFLVNPKTNDLSIEVYYGIPLLMLIFMIGLVLQWALQISELWGST